MQLNHRLNSSRYVFKVLLACETACSALYPLLHCFHMLSNLEVANIWVQWAGLSPQHACQTPQHRWGGREAFPPTGGWYVSRGSTRKYVTQNNVEELPSTNTEALTVAAGFVVRCLKKKIKNFQPVNILQRTLRDRVYLCCRHWPPAMTTGVRRGKDKEREWEGTRLQRTVESLIHQVNYGPSMGQGQLYEFQQGRMLGPALWSQQPHATLQVWGRVAGKLPGSVGWQPAEHEPAVCPGGQEGQQHLGLYQEWCGRQE